MTVPTAVRLDVAGHEEVWRVDCAGATAFVALHAVLAGRAFGGIRLRSYPSADAALHDALRLSHAMSRKAALAGIAGGGGKTVLMVPDEAGERAAAVGALGDFIESLGGRYCCGPDLGYSEADDVVLRAHTRHVAVPGMSGATAGVVEAAMRAALPEPASVAVAGLGAVGAPLARSLAEAGVEVCAADPRGVTGHREVAPDRIHAEPVDVFAPCAAGGVIDARTLPELRCRVVCGGANNPLADDDLAEAVAARGIVLVPDILATSGACIVGASTTLGEEHRIAERLAAVGPRTADVLAEAARRGVPPVRVAEARADERIEALRRG